MKRFSLTGALFCAATLSLALLSAAPAAHAQVLLTDEHVDVDLNYTAGAWEVGLHDEDNDVEYEANEAILVLGQNTRITSPGGAFDATGATAGQPLYVLPQTQQAGKLFLGVGAEEVAPGTFQSNISLTLLSVSGPGQFSVWLTDGSGNPSFFMTSNNGITGADTLAAPEGGHIDFNWGFSQPGIYDVTVQASATLTGGTFTQSDPTTYRFSVAVPEPGTLGLAGMGLIALAGGAGLRRRQQRAL